MKKKISYIVVNAIFIALISTFNSCADLAPVVGNGSIKKVTHKVADFKNIELAGPFKVTLVQDTIEQLVVETDENILEFIQHEVKKGTLKVSCERILKSTQGVKLYLHFITLKNIDISGATDMVSNGKIIFDKISINASGASKVNLELNSVDFDAEFSGNSKAELYGISMNTKIVASGSSEIDADNFLSDKIKIKASGSSMIKLNVVSQLDVEASGSAKVEYIGDPEISKKLSGSASLKKIQ